MTEVPAWLTYPLLTFIVVALVVCFRLLVALSRRVNEHAERIARMEGRRENGDRS